jgi:hypothetical protein
MPAIANSTASVESTELSAGSGSAIAVASVVPAVAGADPAIVSVVATAAFAGAATKVVASSATAEAVAISVFLNEVIVISPFSFLFRLDRI